MTYYLGLALIYLVYLPILTFLKIILFFMPKLQERIRFEKKNKSEEGARSFKEKNLKADLCFEFSSEGEYQQVASLVEDALHEGKKIELVFFSPSVEKAVMDLQAKYPAQLRYFRYPILSLAFSSWVTSETLILVRYDLFPEFLIWSLKPGRVLKFVWVTFKKERVSKEPISAFKRAFLLQAKTVIFSSEADRDLGKTLGVKGVVYDFRMEQIKRRIEGRDEKFANSFPEYKGIKDYFEEFPRHKRLIMGNAWPEDLFLLEKVPSDIFVMIVPHQIKTEIIEKMEAMLKAMGRKEDSILAKKGVLCELYADFGKAYVGGGFGVSVHSLLEPLVAGSDHIACGPVHHRSTEYDLGVEYGSLKEVKTSQEFKKWVTEDILTPKDHGKLKTQVARYSEFKKDVLSC